MGTRLIALALLIAWSRAAGAQDACLSGISTLGDQRAIVALRAAIEATCPCASFTKRSLYQRCAADVIAGALSSSSVRAACAKTAKLIRKGATCGSTRIACGRYRPDHATPLSCRLKPTTRCLDRPRYEQNACAADTHCADVVERTASTCVDVRRQGPYRAGIRVMPFTKDSVVNPGTPRLLNTAVWYPTNVATPISSLWDAVLDAPLDAATAPYPVLLFSHGSCGNANQSRFLTALLATYGFIVVAPPHPGNTIGEFPSCGTPAALAASVQERPQDMLFVLDQMLLENTTPGSPFFGALDPTRIGMSGHSFGGLTTYLTTPLDSRITVAMPMAPAVLGTPSLPVPSLTLLGQVDTYVNNTSIRNAYAAAAAPKYLVELEHGGHFAFSDGCFPSPDCNYPTTLSQSESHDIVLRWAIPFLQRHLAGDSSYASFFAAAPPGVVFASAE